MNLNEILRKSKLNNSLMYKAQGVAVGTIREYKGRKYQKQASGKWLPYIGKDSQKGQQVKDKVKKELTQHAGYLAEGRKQGKEEKRLKGEISKLQQQSKNIESSQKVDSHVFSGLREKMHTKTQAKIKVAEDKRDRKLAEIRAKYAKKG